MKKFIFITLGVMLITLGTFAQPMMGRYMHDLSKYTNVQSYPIERYYFYSDNEVEGDSVITFGSGYYMVKVDNAPDFVVKYNNDNSKAIIPNLHKFFPMRPVEYIVNETDSRITLYNKKPYYGFVYDKKYKVLYRFDSRKYYKRVEKFMRMYPVL